MPIRTFSQRFIQQAKAAASPEGIRRIPILGARLAALKARVYWRVTRSGVSRAAAIGAFFSIATPVAQIPISILLAIALRGHLPTAVLATFLNTPLTFGPVYWFAYQIGKALQSASLLPPGKAVAVTSGTAVLALAAAVVAYALASWLLRKREGVDKGAAPSKAEAV